MSAGLSLIFGIVQCGVLRNETVSESRVLSRGSQPDPKNWTPWHMSTPDPAARRDTESTSAPRSAHLVAHPPPATPLYPKYRMTIATSRGVTVFRLMRMIPLVAIEASSF